MNHINLQVQGITKRFGPFTANDGISFELKSGEILGLLGENGAGKSTLMNVLYGLTQPDRGEILINGKIVEISSPAVAVSLGIGMVHQHFMLIDTMTVAENIALALRETPFVHPLKNLREKIRKFAQEFSFQIDPDARVSNLSAGERQRTELLKVMLHGAEILILDEPTSVLTPGEARNLFAVLRELKAKGKSVIFISHKLEEVLEITDRVIVLKKGKPAGEVLTAQTDRNALAGLMVGTGIAGSRNRGEVKDGEKVLEIDSLTVRSEAGLPAVADFSLTIHSGEIFGIAGVAGNGQRELAEAICGLNKLQSGRIRLYSREIAGMTVREINESGVSEIPEDRMECGCAAGLDLSDNSILKDYQGSPFSRGFLMKPAAAEAHAGKIVEKYAVSTPGIDCLIKYLSGGNIQKMILGREIERRPRLLIASHPTYGLDIGASEFIRGKLLEIRESGAAVLLISEDLNELLGLCSKIAVIFRGRITGIFRPGEMTLEKIGLMMGGVVDN
ncbi:MAG: ABC transporter ATP-binding protein [Candidatus Wallbacteria bacterium]|nr:ABC transporter ATP-binding protein [Candidatus Wallbacteria bacterium]